MCFFKEMFIDMSSTFHRTFVQIAEFDWLPGRLEGLMFEKMFKKSSQKGG